MIAGIGADIVTVARFARPLSPRFFARVFTPYEREYIKNKPVHTTAGLFAAKEAVVKALGTGFSGFWPSEVEIRHDAQGKPYASLRGTLADRHAGLKLTVTISHNETCAMAFAVAED